MLKSTHTYFTYNSLKGSNFLLQRETLHHLVKLPRRQPPQVPGVGVQLVLKLVGQVLGKTVEDAWLTLSPDVCREIFLGHPHLRCYTVQKLGEPPVTNRHRCTPSSCGRDGHSARVWCRDRIQKNPVYDVLAREQSKKCRVIV